MQLNKIYSEAVKKLKKHKIDSAELDAKILLEHATNLSRATIILDPEFNLSKQQQDLFLSLIERRLGNEPIAKIIGKKPFWKNDFFVNRHTLDPRPDSEVIVEESLRRFSDKSSNFRILDLGTGSGCLIISLLLEFQNASGIAIDISSSALEIAKKNAQALGVDTRVEFVQQNWADGISEKFDLIIANPPYISSKEIDQLSLDVKLYDPILALDGGLDGMDPYRYLTKQLKYLLKPGGCAILEFGYDQSSKVSELFRQDNYLINGILSDLGGNQRAISLSI